jgi:hypothetical protein
MICSAALAMKQQPERSLGVLPQAQDVVKRFLLDHARAHADQAVPHV